MIAKRNAEVAEAERDGARGPQSGREARHSRRSRSARHASPPAIRSSPASTTAQPDIYNRERWRIAEVDAEQRSDRPRRHRPGQAGRGRSRVPVADQPPLRGPGARARLRRDDLLGAGRDRRPRLRHGRPLDGQAGALRRRLAQPRGDLPLRDAGDPGPPRGDRPASPYLREGTPAHRRSRRARPRPARRPRRGAAGGAADRRADRAARRPQAAGATGANQRGPAGRAQKRIERQRRVPRRYGRAARAGQGAARASCAASSASGSTAPRRAASSSSLSWRPSFAGCRQSSIGPAENWRSPSRSSASAAAGAHRHPPRPAPLHHQGAGGEAERSGEAEGMGSRRGRDRDLPPASRRQGPEPSAWARGRTGGAAVRAASPSGDSGAARPGTARISGAGPRAVGLGLGR